MTFDRYHPDETGTPRTPLEAYQRRLAVERAYNERIANEDIPARHALDSIRTPEASSDPWKYPPQAPKPRSWFPLIALGCVAFWAGVAIAGVW